MSDHSRPQNFRTVSATVAIPAGSIHRGHLLSTLPPPWCKEILLYSPDNAGDSPESRVQLFALRSIAGEPESEATPADHPSKFAEGQWWLAELDAMVSGGTPDQRRAMAVVRHLIRSAHKTAAGAEELRLAGLALIGLAEHDQHCEVFNLDDDDRHMACSCGLDGAIGVIRAAGKP